jgi:hypothetical protein
MKFLSLLPRLVLGLAFVVFGLNGFYHFLPMKAHHLPGDAAAFERILLTSHYFAWIFICQIIGGALLLIGKAPLGLVCLGPILVNFALFHLLLSPSGYLIAVACGALWLIVFIQNWKSFAPIFKD